MTTTNETDGTCRYCDDEATRRKPLAPGLEKVSVCSDHAEQIRKRRSLETTENGGKTDE